ncbi:PIN domain-containing protein [Limisphaera sp. VF-2]|jgi:predicted nucleic acid-binding protein|uniref:PIN domain-containing protein n=1 Tax=Limisphaera sp. VF-2 TaxID=3400418 RepID=UPI0017577F1A
MKTASWLDSSALLTLLQDEPGTDTVTALLEAAEKGSATLLLSTVSLTEIVSVLARTFGEKAARDDLRLIREMPIDIRSPTQDDCIAAGWLRTQFKLSTADAITAAQARAAGAELVHKDPALEAVPELKQRKLPHIPTKG